VQITAAERSDARTDFARSNTGVVESNPSRGMDACVCLFCVCVVLHLGCGLGPGWSPVQGVLLTVYRITKLKERRGPTKNCRVTDKWMNNYINTIHKTSKTGNCGNQSRFQLRYLGDRPRLETSTSNFFFNPILFAVYTSTFSKLCKNVYNDMYKSAQ
jgi:hypothetical protein